MKPITPVVPGFNLPVQTFAKDQPQYIPLPGLVCDDSTVITRWRFTFRERVALLFRGDLWLSILTFGGRVQPVKLETTCPITKEDAELCELQMRTQQEAAS